VALSRLVLAWLGTLALFLLAEVAAGRRPVVLTNAAQSLLLTLLGSLWFASLGTGAWWLIFLLMGGLMELSAAAGEGKRAKRREWREVAAHALGVVRVVAAGGWLAWQLGPA
jgi:hypothetical protein